MDVFPFLRKARVKKCQKSLNRAYKYRLYYQQVRFGMLTNMMKDNITLSWFWKRVTGL